MIDRLQELDFQATIQIAGELEGLSYSWAKHRILFDVLFIDATEEREASTVVPLFTFGSVLTTSKPVFISASVSGWIGSQEEGYEGAYVYVGAFNPSAETIKWSGRLNTNWQGYGVLIDGPSTAGEES